MNLGITSLLSLNLGAITYNCNFLILLDLTGTWITTAFNTRNRCYQLRLRYCLLTFNLISTSSAGPHLDAFLTQLVSTLQG